MRSSRRKSGKGWPKHSKPKEQQPVEAVRDMYGFAIRPQYVEDYKKTYSIIYAIEEQERSSKWEAFLKASHERSKNQEEAEQSQSQTQSQTETQSQPQTADCSQSENAPVPDPVPTGGVLQRSSGSIGSSSHLWATLRPSLRPIEKALSEKGRRKDSSSDDGRITRSQSMAVGEVEGEISQLNKEHQPDGKSLAADIGETGSVLSGGEVVDVRIGDGNWKSVEEMQEKGHDGGMEGLKNLERSSSGSSYVDFNSIEVDTNAGKLKRALSGVPTVTGVLDGNESMSLRRAVSGVPDGNGTGVVLAEIDDESKISWDDMRGTNGAQAENENEGEESELADRSRELYNLVMLGVPMALRGELWQVFVGTKLRRIEGLYDELLRDDPEGRSPEGGTFEDIYSRIRAKDAAQASTIQIDKDLQRTFPGHPALDLTNGRDALRSVLTAYARKNPDVGYCQGMNFLAGILLLMMPEENAFWTLSGIMDDYLKGYYADQMVEAQVDQLCFEELVRKHFPRLVAHLDMLGVQVTWVSSSWFLSVYVNVLPWESVLRVWDVLLYEGNRSMLFRTGLAIIEMHAASAMVTYDPGDIMSLLQAMAGASFDSSGLILSACVGYVDVDEPLLEEMRVKHRPTVLEMLRERNESLARYQSVNATRLAAEAKVALLSRTSSTTSSVDNPNLNHSPPPERSLNTIPSVTGKNTSTSPTPPEIVVSPVVEGPRRPQVIAAVESHRQSLIRHQSMKGEGLAAAAAAALAELPSTSGVSLSKSRSQSSLSGVSTHSGSMLKREVNPTWMLSQDSFFRDPFMGVNGLPNGSASNGSVLSHHNPLLAQVQDHRNLLVRHKSESPVLLRALAEKSKAGYLKENGEFRLNGVNGVVGNNREGASNAEGEEGSEGTIRRTSLTRHQSLRSEEVGAAVNAALSTLSSSLELKSHRALNSSPNALRPLQPLVRQSSRSPLLNHNMGVLMEEEDGLSDFQLEEEDGKRDGELSPTSSTTESCGTGFETEPEESLQNLRNQVQWLKQQLISALEGQDAAVTKIQELQQALVQLADRLEISEEMDKMMLAEQVKALERRCAELEKRAEGAHERDAAALAEAISRKERRLVAEVDDLLTALAEKEERLRRDVEDAGDALRAKEGELASLAEVVLKLQSEQRTTEDLRQVAERQVVTQREVINLLVEKNKEAVQRQNELEKRARMAESMLQAFMAAAPDAPYSTFGNARGSAVDSSPSTPWGQMDDAKKRNTLWSLLGYKEEAGTPGASEPQSGSSTPTAFSRSGRTLTLPSENDQENINSNNTFVNVNIHSPVSSSVADAERGDDGSRPQSPLVGTPGSFFRHWRSSSDS